MVAPTECNLLGVPLAWKRRCFTYAIDERGSTSLPISNVREAIGYSFAHWEDVRCSTIPLGFDFQEAPKLATCQEAEYGGRSSDGNMNIIAFVDDFDERMLMLSAYAVTIVWHSESSGEIYDADMLINEQMGPFGVCPATGCLDGLTVDLENVVTHEAGHFLGLAHSADEDSTMYYQADRGEILKRTLGTDDVNGLCAAYLPGSLPESCSYTPRHGRDLDCEVESSGRCAVQTAGAPETSTPFAIFGVVGLGFASVVARRRLRR
jgi:hypothetical protein